MVEHHLEQRMAIQISVHSQGVHQTFKGQRLAALGLTDKLLNRRHLFGKRLRLIKVRRNHQRIDKAALQGFGFRLQSTGHRHTHTHL